MRKNRIDRIAGRIAKRGLSLDASPIEKRVAKAMKIVADAKDEEIWRTSENGKHYQLESETGEITKGFGGRKNGVKIQPKASRAGGSGGGENKSSMNPRKTSGSPKKESPKKESSSEYGELETTYKDGTKAYKKKDVPLSPEEHKEWMGAMDNWVKSEATKQLQARGYKRGDIDISIDRDKGTAFVKTWKDDPKSPSGITNEYFNVRLKGTRTTNLRPDGSKKQYVNPDSVELEFAGSELY